MISQIRHLTHDVDCLVGKAVVFADWYLEGVVLLLTSLLPTIDGYPAHVVIVIGP